MSWINGGLPPLPPKPPVVQADSPGDPGGQSWNTPEDKAPWWLWSLMGVILLAYGLLVCWLLFAWWLHP